jgi:hypothetical protein
MVTIASPGNPGQISLLLGVSAGVQECQATEHDGGEERPRQASAAGFFHEYGQIDEAHPAAFIALREDEPEPT